MNLNSYMLIFVVFHFQFQLNKVFSATCKMRDYSTTEIQITNAVEMLGRKISRAQWVRNPKDNVVLCPLSIAIILNLLMLGTNGSSNLEIKKALNYSRDFQEEDIHKKFRDILTSLQQSENGFNIFLNTKIFARKGSEILESYKNVSENYYFTEIQNLDFRECPMISMKLINSWASNITQNKIVNLLSLPLNPNSVCVVYSISFLNAPFENKFNSNLTKNGTFNTGRKNITIPMMTSVMKIPYFRDDKGKFEIVALAYEDKRFSMYILKPTDNASIKKLIQVENSLNSTNLEALISQMKTQRMLMTIPKMRLSQKLDLEMDFRSLEISHIFSQSSADLENFSSNQKLFFNKIFHKAFLEFREHGTNDASVNESEISQTSLPKRFILDQPSILLVRNNDNGLILFWAKVLKPEPLTT